VTPPLINVTARLRWTLVVALACHVGAYGWSLRTHGGDEPRASSLGMDTITEMDIDLVERRDPRSPGAGARD
jgi:hypothetical protein